eukprot:639286-Amphidinium_carterae.1
MSNREIHAQMRTAFDAFRVAVAMTRRQNAERQNLWQQTQRLASEGYSGQRMRHASPSSKTLPKRVANAESFEQSILRGEYAKLRQDEYEWTLQLKDMQEKLLQVEQTWRDRVHHPVSCSSVNPASPRYGLTFEDSSQKIPYWYLHVVVFLSSLFLLLWCLPEWCGRRVGSGSRTCNTLLSSEMAR